MSSKRETQKEEVVETEVVDAEVEVTETVEITDDEQPVAEEAKPKKGLLKKILPYAIGAGAVVLAFVMGKKSSNDDLYLERLEAEYGDKSSEPSDGDETEASDESEDADSKEE